GCCVVRKAEIGAGSFLNRAEVAGHKQIRPSVIVVIEKPGSETARWTLHAGFFGNFRERVVVIVVIKEIWPVKIRNEQIRPSVIFVVCRRNTFAECNSIYA